MKRRYVENEVFEMKPMGRKPVGPRLQVVGDEKRLYLWVGDEQGCYATLDAKEAKRLANTIRRRLSPARPKGDA